MATDLPIDLSQDVPNQLTAIAELERAKLIPKNDYNAVGNPYSATNQDALADGDRLGRGTGIFLDVYNPAAGTIDDIAERRNGIRTNRYNSGNQYPNFQI